MITRLPFLVFLGVFGFSTLCAQGGSGKSETSLTFQVMALGADPLLADLHYLRAPGDAVPLRVSPVRLSKPVIHGATGGGPVTFAVKRVDPDGKSNYVPVARAAWPDGSTDRALVFVTVSGSGNTAKVEAMALDHSLKAFPARSLRVVNFSGSPLIGRFAGFQGEISTGPGRAVPYPQLAEQQGATARFPVALGIKGREGEPTLLFNGWSDAWPHARTLIIVSPGTGSLNGRPKVRFVVDNLPVEPAGKS